MLEGKRRRDAAISSAISLSWTFERLVGIQLLAVDRNCVHGSNEDSVRASYQPVAIGSILDDR